MLQQTQVQVVIPYFMRWMEQFPSIESLAMAQEEEVIKAWEGLGYYSRARNLHRAARLLQQGIPDNLRTLPGFGPYTAGAVASFALRKKAAAVDGNVVRVLSRYFASSEKQRTHYEDLMLKILPDEAPWVVMEATIELGALICKKQPECVRCPIRQGCKAHQQGRVQEFPPPQPRPQTIRQQRHVAIIRAQEKVLVRQEREKKVMEGLYEFPYTALPETLSLRKIAEFAPVKQTFTRYLVTLLPVLYETEEAEVRGYEWRAIGELKRLPFSAGHRRIVEQLYAYFT